MKALKDCEWTIETCTPYGDKWFWWATPNKNTGIKGTHSYFQSESGYLLEQSAKANWRTFAKLNGITKYKFI